MLSRLGSQVGYNGRGILCLLYPRETITGSIASYGNSATSGSNNNTDISARQTQGQSDPRPYPDFRQNGAVDSQDLQGKQVHDFAPAWARESCQEPADNSCRDVARDIPKCHTTNHPRPEMPDTSDRNSMTPQEMVYEDSYQHSSNVSLYSVMQSQVPDPYSSSPTHLNMPSGGESQQKKYISAMLHDTHPTKQYSTSTRPNSTDITSDKSSERD